MEVCPDRTQVHPTNPINSVTGVVAVFHMKRIKIVQPKVKLVTNVEKRII
jgi:hypothetical protein